MYLDICVYRARIRSYFTKGKLPVPITYSIGYFSGTNFLNTLRYLEALFSEVVKGMKMAVGAERFHLSLLDYRTITLFTDEGFVDVRNDTSSGNCCLDKCV